MIRSRHVLWIVLPLLLLIAVTQVLPQVDLPDTAFHENEAPIVAKFRLVQAPAALAGPGAIAGFRAILRFETSLELLVPSRGPDLTSSQSTLKTLLRC
jgi:hypothetical protein